MHSSIFRATGDFTAGPPNSPQQLKSVLSAAAARAFAEPKHPDLSVPVLGAMQDVTIKTIAVEQGNLPVPVEPALRRQPYVVAAH